MENAVKHPDEIIDPFVEEVKRLFGKGVISIILFGSGATGDYIPKRSDLNFLVVLDEESMDHIGKVQKMMAVWQRKKISLPLFITKPYIERSLDSFPIEFLNMQSAYIVVYGEDVLKALQFRDDDIRLQCERELKGKLLQLRQGFILTRGKSKALRLLITDSIVAFTSIFRALLYLKERTMPKTKQDVILSACREFGLDEGLFSVLLSVKEYTATLNQRQLDSNMKKYISEIQKLVGIVDNLKPQGSQKSRRRKS